MDRPFQSPRIGDNVTESDRRTAEHFATQVHENARKEGRPLNEAEQRCLNEQCNAGVLDWESAR